MGNILLTWEIGGSPEKLRESGGTDTGERTLPGIAATLSGCKTRMHFRSRAHLKDNPNDYGPCPVGDGFLPWGRRRAKLSYETASASAPDTVRP